MTWNQVSRGHFSPIYPLLPLKHPCGGDYSYSKVKDGEEYTWVNQYKILKLAVLKFIDVKNLFFPTHVGTLIRLGKLRLSPLVCTHAILSKIAVCLLRLHHFLANICVFLAKTGNSFDVCSFLWGHLVVQGCFNRDFFRLTEVFVLRSPEKLKI